LEHGHLSERWAKLPLLPDAASALQRGFATASLRELHEFKRDLRVLRSLVVLRVGVRKQLSFEFIDATVVHVPSRHQINRLLSVSQALV
jgi:hypothetical protein